MGGVQTPTTLYPYVPVLYKKKPACARRWFFQRGYSLLFREPVESVRRLVRKGSPLHSVAHQYGVQHIS